MLQKIILLALLVGISTGLYAQKIRQTSIRLGYQSTLIHDQLSSPLIYSGHSLAIGGNYRKKASTYLEVDLSLNVGTSQPMGIGQREGVIIDVPDFWGNREEYEIVANPLLSLIQANAAFRLGKAIGQRTHYVGLGVLAHHTYTGMRLDSWPYTQLGLAPFYEGEFSIGKGRLELLAEIPLLMAVVRPNFSSDAYVPGMTSYYLTYVKTEGRVTTGAQLQQPRLRLTYTLNPESSHPIAVGYQGEWLRYQRPEPVRMLNNQLFLQYQF